MRSAFACLLAAILVATTARSAKSADGGLEQARVHVRQATAAYNLGHYAEAAQEYEAAYQLTLDSNMLFNVGQAWRQAGERQKALIAYRSYLRTAPKGEQRGVAEAKLRELEEQRQVESATPASASPQQAPVSAAPVLAPALPPPPAATLATTEVPATSPAPRPFYRHWLFWTAASVVVVAGAATAVLLATRRGEINMPPTDYGAKRF